MIIAKCIEIERRLLEIYYEALHAGWALPKFVQNNIAGDFQLMMGFT